MSKKVERLTNSSDVEVAFVELFGQIDRRVSRYIGFAENGLLKKQALLNVVGMFEILKVMYQQDLQPRSPWEARAEPGIGRSAVIRN
jgi:hypothetical protein